MKKTYINPATNVIKIRVAQMIAGTTMYLGLGDDGNAYNAESRRRHPIWDEEEDEDY